MNELEKESFSPSTVWRVVCVVALLFAGTMMLYWPATTYDFLNFDDDRYVAGNLIVLDGLTIGGVRWAFRAIYESYWLPVMWLSYMLDATLWGRGPFGFHLTNILLHAANASLLFLLINGWTRRFWPAFFVAALFAFHPLRVESVAWIAERKDVLSGFFFLLCLITYKRYADRPVPGREIPAAIFMTLGLMTKPILVTIPFLLLLLDFWPLKRWEMNRDGWRKLWKELIGEKILFWLLSIVFSFLTYHTQSVGQAVHGTDTVPWIRRLLEIPSTYMFYLKKIFYPVDLQMVYGDVAHSLWTGIFSLLLLLCLTGLCWFARKRCPAMITGWFWFLGLLVPVIGLVRVGVVHVADRFTYLPSIGLTIAVVWGGVALLPRRGLNAFSYSVCGFVLLAGCLWQTRAILPHWKNSIAAFERVLTTLPENALANNNYGEALLSSGRTGDALRHFSKAISLEPYTTPYVSNAGMALVLLGRPDEAIELTRRALEAVNEHCPFLNFTQGLAWMEKARPREAIPFLKKAIGNSSDRPTWRLELARAYTEAGMTDQAALEFRQAEIEGGVGLASKDGMLVYYSALWKNGHGRRAWTFFDRALSVDSNNVLMLNNAAWLLATHPIPGGSPDKALELALRAQALAGNNHPNILDTLAAAYAANGNFKLAVHWAEKAVAQANLTGQNELSEKIEVRLQAYREVEDRGH